MRCIDKNCSQNCQYAVLKKTNLKSFDPHTTVASFPAGKYDVTN